MKRVVALAILLGGLSSCIVGPHYQRPVVSVPPAFANPSGSAQNEPLNAQWWRAFGDPELNSLVQRAVAANLDLEQATARVAQARANAGLARAALAPDSELTSSATRNRQRFFTGLLSNGQPDLRAVPYNDFQFGFDASWELDLWGRVRNGYRAAKADLAAQEQDRRDVLVTLLSEVARNYAELRGSQLRLAIAANNQRDERDIVQLTTVRAKAGLATERDVAQAKAALDALEATIPPLEAARLAALHRLSVLVAQEPEFLRAELSESAPLPLLRSPVSAGLPSTLLERRPDIRRSEAQLQAATLRVGVAQADYFPRFTIRGNGARDASQFHDLSLGAGNLFGAGPSVSLPLFNNGRIRSNIRLEQARMGEAAARFKAAVLNALEESEDALTRYNREQERTAKLNHEVEQDRTALELSQVQYKAGLIDFVTVLTAERDLQAAQDEAAQSQIAVTTDLIALYKALGGGWGISPGALLKP